MPIHHNLTNDSTDNTLHQLHLPGYNVSSISDRNSLLTMERGDLAYVSTSGLYFAYSGGNNNSYVNGWRNLAMPSGIDGSIQFKRGEIQSGQNTLVFDPNLNTTTLIQNNIGTTSADSLILINNQAAAAGSQQYSPRIRFTSQGWKTNSTAASQTTDWIIESQPIQDTSNPTASLVISYQANSGGYSALMTLKSGPSFGDQIIIYSTISQYPQLVVHNNVSDANAGYIVARKSRAGGADVQVGDGVGGILFQGKSGSIFYNMSLITSEVTDTSGTPLGKLKFAVSSGTSGALEDALVITQTGMITAIHTTDSTSITTGALQSAGGLGIAKAAFIGGKVDSPIATSGYIPMINYASLSGGAGITTTNTIVCGGTIGYSATVKRFAVDTYVAGTNNGTNYWTVQLINTHTSATISSFNTSADSVNTWTYHEVTGLSTAVSSTSVYINVAKTNSPGAINLMGVSVYVE